MQTYFCVARVACLQARLTGSQRMTLQKQTLSSKRPCPGPCLRCQAVLLFLSEERNFARRPLAGRPVTLQPAQRFRREWPALQEDAKNLIEWKPQF